MALTRPRSDHREELLSRLAGSGKCVIARAQNGPRGKIFLEFFSGKQVVIIGVKHSHISRTLDKHVDYGVPAGANVLLDRLEQIESSLATEKHKQANGHDRIVRAVDAPIFKVHLNRLDRKAFPPRICVDALDPRGARFDRKNMVAPSSRFQAEVAQPRAEIKDLAFEMLDCKDFKRIERVVVVLHLSSELSFKELYGLSVSHNESLPAIQRFREGSDALDACLIRLRVSRPPVYHCVIQSPSKILISVTVTLESACRPRLRIGSGC